MKCPKLHVQLGLGPDSDLTAKGLQITLSWSEAPRSYLPLMGERGFWNVRRAVIARKKASQEKCDQLERVFKEKLGDKYDAKQGLYCPKCLSTDFHVGRIGLDPDTYWLQCHACKHKESLWAPDTISIGGVVAR